MTSFNMVEGNRIEIVTTVKDLDGTIVPLDTVDDIVVMWKGCDNTAALFTKKYSEGSVFINDSAGGIFSYIVDEDATINNTGVFYHEAVITFADGTIATVVANSTMRPSTVAIRKRIATA